VSEVVRVVPEIPPPAPVPTRAALVSSAPDALPHRSKLFAAGIALYIVFLGGIVALGIALGRYISSML
jgi:hypothetical protein